MRLSIPGSIYICALYDVYILCISKMNVQEASVRVQFGRRVADGFAFLLSGVGN